MESGDPSSPAPLPLEDGRATASPGSEPQPLVVGIGASAGGLDALTRFLAAMPADSGLSLVVITHAPGGRESLLPGLLARQSTIPIVTVSAPTPLAPNTAYMVEGGDRLELREGILHCTPALVGGTRNTIDAFFRSLAKDVRERAVGVVLSGTGNDGTLGITAIKGASGMTMAQEEASARFSAMPHSAITSLQVDYVLRPENMPARLVAYARSFFERQRQPLDGAPTVTDQFSRIFMLLRARSGHDFSQYKGSTVRRRIERRMNVHAVPTLRDYLQLLQGNATELDSLFKELLIGVTSFFRDPEAHQALVELVLPQLLENKPAGYTLRLWVAGCSTGEEAYSLAIAIKEAMERARLPNGVQMFATDIDAEAIAIARQGEYPDSIAGDVSPGRLDRFFTRESDGYFRIKKEIREMMVFAPHSLIQDPPFTKVDLLSCRNLLIYLDGRLQQQLMPLFHHSLRPGGVLFLGSSENVGGFSHLFETLDKKWKIFRRKEGPAASYLGDLRGAATEVTERGPRPAVGPAKLGEAILLPAAERALLHNLVPPSVIVSERGEIIHVHGRTGLFLEPAPGPPGSANLYSMAREGLKLELAVSLRQAAASEGTVVRRGAKVTANGQQVSVDLRVKRLTQPEAMKDLFLVAFEQVEPGSPTEPRQPAGAQSPQQVTDRLAELERDLELAKEVHQRTIEELEAANEELKSTNEEMQSTNEELQSANEELETSKEEMQSLNEELQTVNAELQGKVEELSQTNDDMKNLLNGTDIATIFLDRHLNIKRYTDQARKLIRLIPSDVGRPVGDLVSKLKYNDLTDDVQAVLRSLMFKEAEVQAEDGSWYLMRMLPYRTTENVIDGVVVTFVDITKMRGLQQETGRLLAAVASGPVGIFGQDGDLTYRWAFGNVAGRRAEEVIGCKDEELFGEAAAEVVELKRAVLLSGRPVRQRVGLGGQGGFVSYDLFVQPMGGGEDRVPGLTGIIVSVEPPGADRPGKR
jgi:two-component system, chemotaxis family, CheB/CheR fusion protein